MMNIDEMDEQQQYHQQHIAYYIAVKYVFRYVQISQIK